ncbi:hypothetical protein HLV39_00310 [Marinobacter adhaerens]|uniref:Uncharacterized protein n=1 Tax=Marinobacter adhaerens TaxID=1033846 RepID=A0A851HM93_9GAMM|nr:hypothetical protein [Marinobacter adhaerens]NWN89937.1 hypothetical protein [Marinobacter adhaerens]
MTYDANFDQARLDQLAGQYLRNSDVVGRVLFFSESEDNRFDYGAYQLSDSDYEAIKASGFKMHLLELIDTLLVYRSQHNQPNASQGAIHLNGEKISIEWLPKETAEAMRNEDYPPVS